MAPSCWLRRKEAWLPTTWGTKERGPDDSRLDERRRRPGLKKAQFQQQNILDTLCPGLSSWCQYPVKFGGAERLLEFWGSGAAGVGSGCFRGCCPDPSDLEESCLRLQLQRPLRSTEQDSVASALGN